MSSATPIRLAVSGAVLALYCATIGLAATTSAPRIVQLSAAPPAPAIEPIREPAPSDSAPNQPAARQSRRSEYVPLALPAASGPPQASVLPELPAEPAFTSPEGPQLNPPSATTLALAAPQAIQPQPPAVAALPARTGQSTWQPAAEPTQPPAPSPQPTTSTPLQVVAERALHKADRASAMAQRGMLYSARTELIQALQIIAQSLDIQHATSAHAAALSAGLTALEEARDFSAQTNRPGEEVNVPAIAAAHRTPLLRAASGGLISPVVAQQQYLGLAQTRFIEAAGRVPVASQILYRLGRLQTALAAHDPDPLALHGPEAIVFHQAALATDSGNWLAANELGVLYARYGQLPAAKQLLLTSVTTHPHVAGWQNLAAIHRRLGETDLADRAEAERQLLASKTGAANSAASGMVRWVDQQTFAASGGADVSWPASVAARPAPSAAPVRR